MAKHIGLLILMLIVLVPSTILAQDDDSYTCDDDENDALKAAQAAFDLEDYETSVELAGIAEGLCSSDLQRFRAATDLKARAQAALNTQLAAALEPGFVELEDYTVFMVCEGELSDTYPPVIFENGLGEIYTTWRDIQPIIAEVTLACAYDRFGVGNSDGLPSGDTRTAFEQAETLHLLLEELDIEPPFIYVGHSIAGLPMLAYPHLYPDEIAGLVFVDASHPEQQEHFAEVDSSQANAPSVVGGERVDISASRDELEVVENFGDLPMVVLHQTASSSIIFPVWLELQENHASRSTNSRLIEAENSGHFVHYDEPDLVVEAIMWVLDESIVDVQDTTE